LLGLKTTKKSWLQGLKNTKIFMVKTLLRKKLVERAKVGHGNRAAVSRNRYGVEKTVDTHQILINAIKFYVCLQKI
jgi:hypothetical protein